MATRTGFAAHVAGAALAASTLLTGGVGHARPSATGHVLLPAPPNVARTAHVQGLGTTPFGTVIDLGGKVPTGSDYRLIKTRGSVPTTDLDVWFYEDINGTGAVCPYPRDVIPDGDGGERGPVTCNARWAVVVLFTGADADFKLLW